ncbi:transposase family protein [Nonomuraea sp. MTCD27]|uniref:transposase family protein n=1 Tax=Nonomuraea sp. MTCD27 TaxID=1676747 RepID=UPI0035C11764
MLIAARTVVSEVPCPECGLLSTRVHSRYRRTVWDLATGGRPVKVELEVRRFFCGEPSCDPLGLAASCGAGSRWRPSDLRVGTVLGRTFSPPGAVRSGRRWWRSDGCGGRR